MQVDGQDAVWPNVASWWYDAVVRNTLSGKEGIECLTAAASISPTLWRRLMLATSMRHKRSLVMTPLILSYLDHPALLEEPVMSFLLPAAFSLGAEPVNSSFNTLTAFAESIKQQVQSQLRTSAQQVITSYHVLLLLLCLS
jgi:hypothetical protein